MDYESLFKAARKAGTALTDVEPERLGRILQHAARLLRFRFLPDFPSRECL